MTDLIMAILYGTAAVSNRVTTIAAEAAKETQGLRAEIAGLKCEIAKNKTSARVRCE